jgi:hypothetical protein
MATRNWYVKLQLSVPSPTNLMGATVVGQYDTVLLVERPQPSPRSKLATPKNRSAKPRSLGTTTLSEQLAEVAVPNG